MLHNSAEQALNASYIAHTAWDIASNEREIAFAPLNKLVTRLINALIVCDVPQQSVDDLRTLVRKIQGVRAKRLKKPVTTAGPVVDAAVENPKTRSASQMGFDNRLAHFEKIVELLAGHPNYTPNQPELQVPSLIAMLSELRARNARVTDAFTDLSNARITRNEILYRQNAAVVEVAGDVKTYVKSLFGASSPQYRQMGGLRFNKLIS